MSNITSYRDLEVWQVSMELVESCFDVAEAIPGKYQFTFSNQLVRAGISIPSNIAEGSRRPVRAYLNHLSYSLGSEAEVSPLFEVIKRRKLAPTPLIEHGEALSQRVGQMLHGLKRSLEI